MQGYFFATSQSASQKNLAAATGKILHAKEIVASPEPKQVSEEVIGATLADLGFPGIGFYMFANNSRASADRARKELGYAPKAPSLWESLEGDVEDALEKA
jgi:hypothetical protein